MRISLPFVAVFLFFFQESKDLLVTAAPTGTLAFDRSLQEEETMGPFCSEALEMYRKSNGTNYTEVSFECLTLQECEADDAITSSNVLAIQNDITCNFTEIYQSSEWSDCNTTSSQSSEEMGNLLTFSVLDFSPGKPLVRSLNVSLEAGNITISWGIVASCDGYVYLLYNNLNDGEDEDLYEVIGYQSLEVLEDVNGGVVEGTAGIHAEAASGIELGGCAFGHSFFQSLEGECRMAFVDTDQTGVMNPANETSSSYPSKSLSGPFPIVVSAATGLMGVAFLF